MVNFKIGIKICVKAVFFSKKKSLLKVFFQVQKWSSFGLIFMKLGLPEKLGTLLLDLSVYELPEVLVEVGVLLVQRVEDGTWSPAQDLLPVSVDFVS